MTHWGDVVQARTAEKSAFVLGIDPLLSDIPLFFRQNQEDPTAIIEEYGRFLLNVAENLVGFIKFQSAFFEAHGAKGLGVLARLIATAKERNLAVILDAKRGDVGGTARAYAQAYLTPRAAGGLSDLEVDALTINPFLGPETLEPFVACARDYGKGLFILVKTSNPGAGWLQDREIDGARVSDRVADLVAGWAAETKGSLGLSSVGAVVGATYPADGKRLRTRMPDSIFLAPGLGPQGGKIEEITSLTRPKGGGILVPVQRGVTKVADLSLSREAYKMHVLSRLDFFRQALPNPKQPLR